MCWEGPIYTPPQQGARGVHRCASPLNKGLRPTLSITPCEKGAIESRGSVLFHFKTEAPRPILSFAPAALRVVSCGRSIALHCADHTDRRLFHAPARNQQWFEQWNRNNPQSPLNLYKDGSVLKSDVVAISFFERANGVSDLAQVRYSKVAKQGSTERSSHWIATIQYAYGQPATDPKIRRWNPLGFKVVSFRSEPEVLDENAVAQVGAAP